MPIQIAILDDHQIVIDGLKLLLERSENLSVVMEDTDGFEMLRKLKQGEARVDILLLDLMMPVISGYEFALMVKKEFPAISIIILSMNNDAKTVYNLIEHADIRGFLPKSVNKNELISTIEKVQQGGQHFSDEILEELEHYSHRRSEYEQLKLSAREMEIIALIAKGHTNKKISEALFISEKTVETHRKNIFRKTGAHNVASLLDMANRLELLK